VSKIPDPSDFFECQKCGECCKGFGGTFLREHDIDRITEYLGIGRDEFLRRYCDWSGKRRLLRIAESGYCIFWDEVCTIHEVKPRMCKVWPFIDAILVDGSNWDMIKSVCPGVRDNGKPEALVDCVKRVLADFEKIQDQDRGIEP